MELVPEPEREPVAKAIQEGPWLNAHRPLTVEDLRQAPTMLVRWRAGDLAAISALLQAAARAPGSGARVIGLHVPGHPAERDPAHVLDAILREGVHVPVRHDPDGRLARRLGLPVGPSVAWLDREGRLAGHAACRPGARVCRHAQALEPADPSTAKRWPVRGEAPGPTELLYPQGLDAHGSVLAIADTGHHRVIVLQPDEAPLVIGDGAPGEADGPAHAARFSRPRGLHLAPPDLLVADTGNGSIRRIDLESGRGGTLARTHQLDLPARGPTPMGPTPWDLAPAPGAPDSVLVSLMGRDAIVHVDRANGSVAKLPVLGSGRTLVRPAGLAADDERVYVAEPLRAALRVLEPRTGRVRTLLDARTGPLEHPTAVAPADDGQLVVADPYAQAVFSVGTKQGRWQQVGPAPPVAEGSTPRAVAPTETGLAVAWGPGTISCHDAAEGGWRERGVEVPLPEADHRLVLDPVEAAPDARLTFKLVAHAQAPGSLSPRPPEVRGPLDPRVVGEPNEHEGALEVAVEARLAATGHATVRWTLEAQGAEASACWRLPLIVRPGADPDVEIQLSTRIDEQASPSA